jgi:hypothetical protein
MPIKSITASVTFSLILLAATSAMPQDQATTGVTVSSSATVTAAVTESNAIRFSSPGEISNIRLEVYAPAALSGTGTTNRIARWMDNLGTLGDSVNLFDNGTNVGIGNTNPQLLVHIGPNNGYGATTGLLLANNLLGTQYDRAFQIAPRRTARPSTNSIMIYALPTVNAGVNVPSQYGIVMDANRVREL